MSYLEKNSLPLDTLVCYELCQSQAHIKESCIR